MGEASEGLRIHSIDARSSADVAQVTALLHVLYPESLDRSFMPSQQSDGVETLLARRSDEKAVGLIVTTLVHDGWEPYGVIDQLVVIPECRHQGIGRRLVSEGFARLADLGAVVVFVTTNDGAAESFYRRQGFDSTGPWLAKATHPTKPPRT